MRKNWRIELARKHTAHKSRYSLILLWYRYIYFAGQRKALKWLALHTSCQNILNWLSQKSSIPGIHNMNRAYVGAHPIYTWNYLRYLPSPEVIDIKIWELQRADVLDGKSIFMEDVTWLQLSLFITYSQPISYICRWYVRHLRKKYGL